MFIVCLFPRLFYGFFSFAFQLDDLDVVPSPEPLLIEAPFTVQSLHHWGFTTHTAAHDDWQHLTWDIIGAGEHGLV